MAAFVAGMVCGVVLAGAAAMVVAIMGRVRGVIILTTEREERHDGEAADHD